MTANEVLEEIEEMLDDEKYSFAFETLQGIKITIGRTGEATEAQQRAVQNIKSSKSSNREARSDTKRSRRWEGFK